MKKGLIIGGIIAAIVVIAIVIFGSILWGSRGDLVTSKNNIEAQHLTNQSDYDKMWKTFKEMAQVTDLQADQVKEVYTDLISGRYEGDENLAVKMITESNPSMDTSLYANLSNQIAADRATFNNNQKKLLDIINVYNTMVEHDKVIAASIFGFDKIDSSKYIVTSERTDNAFETGKDEEIKLND